MKNQYKISEVSKALGVSADTLRFYEKENIIKPQRNEKNGYRYYTVQDINNLLNIIFYRKMDIGIEDIKDILFKNNFDDMRSLIQSKTIDVKKRIEEQSILLKKLHQEERAYDVVEEAFGKYSIKQLPPLFMLNEIFDDSYVEGMTLFSNEYFEICSLCTKFKILDKNVIEDKYYVVMSENTAKDFKLTENVNPLFILSYPKCVYTVIRVLADEITYKSIEDIILYIEDNDYEIYDEIIAVYIFTVYENKKPVDFMEIYVPIK